MKVLNLHAGIGGNRKLWSGVDVTAVEHDPDVAEIYSSFFPEDEMVVGDAGEYLSAHYDQFDFIWASPPCPTHSRIRQRVGVKTKGHRAVMPDMTLYSFIIFLKHHHSGMWVVENTVPYYEPLIKYSAKLSRHVFWSNVPLELRRWHEPTRIRDRNSIQSLEDYLGISLEAFDHSEKRKLLRNCTHPDLGLFIISQMKEVFPLLQNDPESFAQLGQLSLF